MYYSPSKDCVYLEDFKSKYEFNNNWPSDAVKISQKDFEEFFLSDKTISNVRKYTNGLFVWGDRPSIVNDEEREWRNLELIRADIELNKIQDSDPKAVGSVGDWRLYRKQLRNWPQSPDFPDKYKRPVSPDT